MFGQRSPTYSHKRVLVVAAFTDICAGTFAYDAENQENLIGAQAGTASVLFIALPMFFGFFEYRKHAKLLVATIVGVGLLFLCIYVGYAFPVLKLSKVRKHSICFRFCLLQLPVVQFPDFILWLDLVLHPSR